MSYFTKYLSGFTLVDVLVGIVMTSFLVLVILRFSTEVARYNAYISRHQQIRSETFALINNTLATLIRQAASLDYANTNQSKLGLFMDKLERDRVMIELKTVPQQGGDSPSDKKSQLVLTRGSKVIYLNSTRTVFETFDVQTTKKPSSANLQQERSIQPIVRITLQARHQRNEGALSRTVFSFFEDPWISYKTSYTLRNYSFSNLRSL